MSGEAPDRPARPSLLAGAGAMALGLAMMGLGAPPFEVSFLTACGMLPEGSSFRLSGLWWPPGATRCTAELPGGATVVRTHLPWADWLTVGLTAGAVAAFTHASTGRARRRPALAAAGALLLCAMVTWGRGAVTGAVVAAGFAVVALAALAATGLRGREGSVTGDGR